MPTYQYACTECGEQLEAVQKFTDDPLTECPACHGRLRKVFNSVGIVFKGSGFYRTDSRSSSNGKISSDAAGKPAESKPTESAKSEKPASATSSATTSSTTSSAGATAKAASA